MRLSDQKWWDTGSPNWIAYGSPEPTGITLTEDGFGVWYASGWTIPSSDDEYQVIVIDDSGNRYQLAIIIVDNANRSTIVVEGTCTASTTGDTTFSTNLTPSTNQYQNMWLRFKSDSTTAELRNQTSQISTVTSGGVFTLKTALTTSTANTDTFEIF